MSKIMSRYWLGIHAKTVQVDKKVMEYKVLGVLFFRFQEQGYPSLLSLSFR